jgi:uncharacterized membrane protein
MNSHVASLLGEESYGRYAEAFTRLVGRPVFLVGQTVIVMAWIAVNFAGASLRWDPYPFILLNLVFSLEAAYAAPLILLAQTRQADRDKAAADEDARHRDALANESLERQKLAAEQGEQMRSLLASNNAQTEQLRALLESNTTQTKELRGLLESNIALSEETRRLAKHVETLTAELNSQVRESSGASAAAGGSGRRGAEQPRVRN